MPTPAQVIRDVWHGAVSADDFELTVRPLEDPDDLDGCQRSAR